MAGHHLIVGGQRSGKSRQAESLALQWLRADATRHVTVVATAMAHDDEMRERIRRHQADRPAGFDTQEIPLALADSLKQIAAPQRLIVVDCLTLWLTNWLMPLNGKPDAQGWQHACQGLLDCLPTLASPVVFISNEVGWGIVPLSSEVRAFVDELGRLNQQVAARCAHLSLMVAGQAWTRDVQVCGDV